jgi:hypothetical protein
MQKENSRNKRKNFMLYLIITIIIVYIAVPTYALSVTWGIGGSGVCT